MAAYYNEIDPFAAEWLRSLIRDGYIAPGEVDTRDIKDVAPNDLRDFEQCHFFAGIGGWSYALRLAGWPDDKPVWTGSCPCQPFSAAGRGKGFADERHLWPYFYWLISEHRPSIVFGEQVASKAGRIWLDGVRADMEALAYGVGAADLCAAGVGAPHIRQRLYWVADAGSEGRRQEPRSSSRDEGADGWQSHGGNVAASGGAACGLADTMQPGRPERRSGAGSGSTTGSGSLGAWAEHEWLACLDGKARRIEPGSFPLAHGVPGRVGRLCGYGNAIVPQVAAEFIAASQEAFACLVEA